MRCDLAHLQRVQAILDVLAAGDSIPHAIIACEDALVALTLGCQCGLSLEKTADLAREAMTQEETRRVLCEHGTRPVDDPAFS